MKDEQKNSKKDFIIILLAVCLAPLIFTTTTRCGLFDFTHTGEIGDTIGGTTAPIIGLVSIYLIYITYQSQKEEFQISRDTQKEEFEISRKSQKEELDSTREFVKIQTQTLQLDQNINIIENLLKETNESIGNLEWQGLKGLEAIRNFDGTAIGSYFDYLNAIILRFRILIIEANKIEKETIKENYLNRIYISFYSKILWTVKSRTFDYRETFTIFKNDDVRRMMFIFSTLSLESFTYLESKNHILLLSEHKLKMIEDFNDFIKETKQHYPEVTNLF